MNTCSKMCDIKDSSLFIYNNKSRIGILGGTFNPPHIGHLDIAKKICIEFALDKILFLPVGMPPHKKNVYVADKFDRAAMVELLIQHEPNMEVCMIEILREGYTYTIDSISELRMMYPNTEFYYIIGTDTLYQLETWRNFRRVFELTKFICIFRPGDDMFEINEYIDRLKREYSVDILLSESSGPDISSTEIRELIFKNQNISGYVSERVSKYIKENNVYDK